MAQYPERFLFVLGVKMNLRLIELVQECEKLTVAEAKTLIHHLKMLIDAEDLQSKPTGWRKRIIEGKIEESFND